MTCLKYLISAAGIALNTAAFAAAPVAPSAALPVTPPVVLEQINVIGKFPDLRLKDDLSAVNHISRQDIVTAIAPRVDDLLADIPGVSLFRRSDSRMAHPTAQGVTIRNIGPNGTGRSLVLLDGVPLNDPFGGSVAWGRVPLASLERIDIVRGGNAGAWGSAGLGGVIAMQRRQFDKNGIEFQGSAGSRNTVDLSGLAALTMPKDAITVSGSYYNSDGAYNLRPADRGPIDRPLGLKSGTGEFSLRHHLSDDIDVKIWGDYFHEERGNGTPYTTNSSTMKEAALSLVRAGGPRDISWQLSSYIQSGSFASTFSSVNADRSSETPALNQYHVPSHALGFSATMTLPLNRTGRLEVGADSRFLKGETDEYFTYSGNSYQRNRVAGGAQDLAGAFIAYHWTPNEAFEASLTGRGDYWNNHEGHRIETVIASGAALTDRTFAGKDGWQGNGNLALAYKAAPGLKFRASAYSGYRLPSINELYRPYRVRNTITEANPDLGNEKLTGIEGGLNWQAGSKFSFDGDIFYNRLAGAVANVTVSSTPGLYAPLGVFIPAGGSLSQRQNLAHVNILGLEANAHITLVPELKLDLGYMYSHNRVGNDVVQTALRGKRLAEVPSHEFSAGLQWQPDPKLNLNLKAKYESNQYEDDLNQQPLGDFVEVDLGLGYRLSPAIEIFAGVENLFNRENNTAVDQSGLRSIGTPRLFHLGIRLATFDRN